MEDTKSTTTQEGFVYESLSRTSKQIRAERGDAIAEDLEMAYKRGIEDTEMKLKRLRRKQRNNFDFSPTNATSLVMGKDVDAGEVKSEDLAIELEVRNETIKLELAKKRYNYLFGEKYKVEE